MALGPYSRLAGSDGRDHGRGLVHRESRDSEGSGAISSVFGLAGIPHQSAYCASKFALRKFTESLRHELIGTGVRAIPVHPGGVDPNIARHGRPRTDSQGRGRR
jgi:NAD(P)-dependent dehydrogenase (short-subunit alcohol dehydrogenase family)